MCLQQHIPLADSTSGMISCLLDFIGLILWLVAIAPGAKSSSITVHLVKTSPPRNSRQGGLLWGSQASSSAPGRLSQVLLASSQPVQQMHLQFTYTLSSSACLSPHIYIFLGGWPGNKFWADRFVPTATQAMGSVLFAGAGWVVLPVCRPQPLHLPAVPHTTCCPTAALPRP